MLKDEFDSGAGAHNDTGLFMLLDVLQVNAELDAKGCRFGEEGCCSECDGSGQVLWWRLWLVLLIYFV